MAHSAQPPIPPRRRREIVVGSVLLVVGLVAVIVAVIALRHPKGREAGVADTSAPTTSASSTAPLRTTTPATGTPATSTRPPTTPPSSTTPVTTTPVTTTPVTTTPAASTAGVSTPVAAANRLPLIVLNNTGNAAATTSALTRLRAGGWTVTDGGFFDGDILSTAAYYDPDADGSRAAALALQTQFPAIKRVVARFSGLPAGPVVVILTTDYS